MISAYTQPWIPIWALNDSIGLVDQKFSIFFFFWKLQKEFFLVLRKAVAASREEASDIGPEDITSNKNPNSLWYAK